METSLEWGSVFSVEKVGRRKKIYFNRTGNMWGGSGSVSRRDRQGLVY